MDTTTVRGAHVAAPRPPSTAPAVGPGRDRSVLVAALLLVAGQLVLRGWLVGRRDYYADDFRLLQLADRSPLLSPSYLLTDFDGQLMPGGLLVAGLVERAAPLAWWPAAVSLGVLQALASLALLRLLRVLLGERPVLLVPLAVGLFTPITLGSTTWWAAALNSLPLQIGLAWFLAEAVLLARTGRRRHAIGGTAALALTLACYLKAVLLPPIAFVVVAVVLLAGGAHSPARQAWRRARPLWLGSLAVLGGWAVTYGSTREGDPVMGGSAGDVLVTVVTGLRALVPAVVGGPYGWELVAPGTPLSTPPTASVVAGALVLVAAGTWTSRRLRGATVVWALVVATVLAGLLLAALGRAGLGLGHVLPYAYRYFAVESVLLPVAGALLLSLPARDATRRQRRPPWHLPVTAALTGLFVTSALLSALGHARAWQRDATGPYLETARASLAAAGPAPLLDQPLPPDVLWAGTDARNRAAAVLGPLPDRPEFASSTHELRVLDGSGALRPADVVPGARLAPGPYPPCGWAVDGNGTTVALTGALPDGRWTVALRYLADRDGTIDVALGDEAPVRAVVSSSRDTVYLHLVGGGGALQVTAHTPGLGVCLGAGVVGTVAVG